MDSHFLWNAILTIGMTVISGFIALGAKYLNQIQKTFEAQMTAQDKKIDEIRDDYKRELCAVSGKTEAAQEDLNKFKVTVQRDFVSREDYIKTSQNLGLKLDRLLEEIGNIRVSVGKLTALQEVKNK